MPWARRGTTSPAGRPVELNCSSASGSTVVRRDGSEPMSVPRLSTRIRQADPLPDCADVFGRTARGHRRGPGRGHIAGGIGRADPGASRQAERPAPFEAPWPHSELFLTACVTVAVTDGEYRISEARRSPITPIGFSARQLADLESRVLRKIVERVRPLAVGMRRAPRVPASMLPSGPGSVLDRETDDLEVTETGRTIGREVPGIRRSGQQYGSDRPWRWCCCGCGRRWMRPLPQRHARVRGTRVCSGTCGPSSRRARTPSLHARVQPVEWGGTRIPVAAPGAWIEGSRPDCLPGLPPPSSPRTRMRCRAGAPRSHLRSRRGRVGSADGVSAVSVVGRMRWLRGFRRTAGRPLQRRFR